MIFKRYRVLELFVSFLVIICTLTNCASSKKKLPEVEPIALLSDDAYLYLYVPVKAHESFLLDILEASSANISEKDARSVLNRIQSFYSCIGEKGNSSHIELIAEGSFPSVGVKNVFTKKKGWATQVYEANAGETDSKISSHKFTYYEPLDGKEIEVSFPSSSRCIISENAKPIFNKYLNAQDIELSESNYASWLQNKGDNILFYLVMPGQNLWKMFGLNISLSCNSISGKLSSIDDSAYGVSVLVTMPDKLSAFAAKRLLPLIGGKVKEIDELTLSVSGMQVQKKLLVDTFSKLIDERML